jgi:catechol 2,3-dioxygenase-like lactoylglutathione lyase family enzyme
VIGILLEAHPQAITPSGSIADQSWKLSHDFHFARTARIGRGVYFEDPNGHLLEIITRPYGSGDDAVNAS